MATALPARRAATYLGSAVSQTEVHPDRGEHMAGPRIRSAAVAALLLATVPSGLRAQLPGEPSAADLVDWRTTSTIGIGYVANGPRAIIGATAYTFAPALRGFGVYADFRMTHETYDRGDIFMPGVSAQQAEAQFGDSFLQTLEHWTVGNIGLIRPVTSELAVFAGVGYARGNLYQEYYDVAEERGHFGVYRALDEESGNRVNVGGGVIFRLGRHVGFHFGGEVAPRGFLAGASLLFPY
jgi:hypothetical protein